MNIICIAGQLGQDSELKYLPNGDPVLSFSVADQQGRDKPTIWWRCSLFGKRAESLAQYLLKGQKVTVSGNVTEREYTDNRDGTKKKAQDVRVQDVALQGDQRQQQAPAERPAPQPSEREQNRNRQYAQGKPQPNFADMDDDLPF